MLQNDTIYLFVGGHAFVTCIGYVVFAENLLTGITFHWKKVWNDKESSKHQGSTQTKWDKLKIFFHPFQRAAVFNIKNVTLQKDKLL